MSPLDLKMLSLLLFTLVVSLHIEPSIEASLVRETRSLPREARQADEDASAPAADTASDEESADPPADEEAADPPNEEEGADPPKEKKDVDPPAEGEAADPPAEGEAADPPAEEAPADQPAEGEATGAPKEKEAADTPAEDKEADQPTGEEDAEKLKDAEDIEAESPVHDKEAHTKAGKNEDDTIGGKTTAKPAADATVKPTADATPDGGPETPKAAPEAAATGTTVKPAADATEKPASDATKATKAPADAVVEMPEGSNAGKIADAAIADFEKAESAKATAEPAPIETPAPAETSVPIEPVAIEIPRVGGNDGVKIDVGPATEADNAQCDVCDEIRGKIKKLEAVINANRKSRNLIQDDALLFEGDFEQLKAAMAANKEQQSVIEALTDANNASLKYLNDAIATIKKQQKEIKTAAYAYNGNINVLKKAVDENARADERKKARSYTVSFDIEDLQKAVADNEKYQERLKAATKDRLRESERVNQNQNAAIKADGMAAFRELKALKMAADANKVQQKYIKDGIKAKTKGAIDGHKDQLLDLVKGLSDGYKDKLGQIRDKVADNIHQQKLTKADIDAKLDRTANVNKKQDELLKNGEADKEINELTRALDAHKEKQRQLAAATDAKFAETNAANKKANADIRAGADAAAAHINEVKDEIAKAKKKQKNIKSAWVKTSNKAHDMHTVV